MVSATTLSVRQIVYCITKELLQLKNQLLETLNLCNSHYYCFFSIGIAFLYKG